MTEVKISDEKRIGTGKAGPGRPKGVPNKQTQSLRAAILEAGANVGDALRGNGMVGYLEHLAENHPPAYSQLLSKILPQEVNASGTIAITKIELAPMIDVTPAADMTSLITNMSEDE